jgi:hypothetical protein|tara:strand:- start:1196 stop:1381 length:186 start_codon:yes stop_codon:yes gene_type:complete
MKVRHHVAIQMEKEQKWQKENGIIVLTADELWRYSGLREKNSKLSSLTPQYRKKEIKPKKK